VPPEKASRCHNEAWVTIARNRSVWVAIQFAIYPPKDPPIAAVRVSSISGSCTAASTAAIRSV
jgi:hypothetical protein